MEWVLQSPDANMTTVIENCHRGQKFLKSLTLYARHSLQVANYD